MRILKISFSVLVLFFFIFSYSQSFSQEAHKEGVPNTLMELKSSILDILKASKTPGAGVVLVSGDETVFLEGLGKADIENNIAVNENTMFRLGSVSKVFVALAILKLQEEGRLTLKDKIKDLIPEIKFNNPWEEKYPIRIENLLEHTTGWDEWHFAELGSDDPKPKTLKEALDFYPKARTSRFIPGTRIGYSNVGTSVAAYIVEKVSGLTFEEYVEKYFFKPMGMENMTYLESEQYKKSGAKLYANGVKLDYFNILYRPSAALNGSPKDMARMIKFFINRGMVNKNQIISEPSLQRMEISGSMPLFSKSEIFKFYGLANNPSFYNGFIYRGHGGSLPGGNADFGYLPEYNVGFAVMINGDDEDVLIRIANLIKCYQTKDLIKDPVKIDKEKYNITVDPSGYYTIINPKIKRIGFIERIKNIQKVWVKNDTLFKKSLLKGNSTKKYIPAANNEFRSANTKLIDLALINDPVDGNIICCHGYLKKISPVWAYFLISLLFVFPISLLSTTIFGLLRILIYLFGSVKNKKALWVCIWPLITNSFVFIIILSFSLKVKNRYDLFQTLGTLNSVSVLIFVCSIAYAFASAWSGYYIIKNRHEKMSKMFYYHSALATLLNLVFTLYFLGNGLIGYPTWC